jgi:hypothetical protein
MLTPSPQLIRLALPDGLPPAVYLSSFGCVALRVALSHLPQAPARFGALFNPNRPTPRLRSRSLRANLHS